MTSGTARPSSESGYSIVEMLFALGLLALLSSMAMIQLNVLRPGLKGDGAMRVVLAQLNQARETAIAQRRYVRVVFTAPDFIQTVREDTTTSTTALSNARLEGGPQFLLVSGLPDTPDRFGNSAALAFGTAIDLKFSPEGTLVNQDGASINGTAFLAVPNQPRSARAITLLGATGRIRGYRWDGSKWSRV